MKRVLRFFVDREWVMATAVAAALVSAITDGLGMISDTAPELVGVDPVSAAIVMLGLFQRLNVFSRSSVEKIKRQL